MGHRAWRVRAGIVTDCNFELATFIIGRMRRDTRSTRQRQELPLYCALLGGVMVGRTRTKPHHNDTLIASAHLSKYTSISLACWGATHAPPQASNVRHFAPHEGRAFLAGGCCTSSASSSSSCGCQRHARWPSLFHLEGCNTTHMTVASSSPRSASGSHSTSSAPAGSPR